MTTTYANAINLLGRGADHVLVQDPVQAQALLLDLDQVLDQVQQLVRQGQDPGRLQNLEMKMRRKHLLSPQRRLKISLVTIFQSVPMTTMTKSLTNQRKSQ